jgi:hypothetical protein
VKVKLWNVLKASPIGDQPVASDFQIILGYQAIHGYEQVHKKLGIFWSQVDNTEQGLFWHKQDV